MSDADLIYNACLRAERRFEVREEAFRRGGKGAEASANATFRFVLQTLREEIGRGLSEESRRVTTSSDAPLTENG